MPLPLGVEVGETSQLVGAFIVEIEAKGEIAGERLPSRVLSRRGEPVGIDRLAVDAAAGAKDLAHAVHIVFFGRCPVP